MLQKQLQAIVIDDNPSSHEIIQNFINRTPYILLQKCFDSPIDVISYLQVHEVDLLFVDIEMDDLNGIELIKHIKSTHKSSLPYFIIISGYDYALESFELNVVDYLLKPISLERFLQAVHKVVELKKKEEELLQVKKAEPLSKKKYLFVPYNKKHIRVEFVNILYMQSDEHYLKIFVKGYKYPFVLTMSIRKMEALVSPDDFLKVNRSYIINLAYLKEFSTKTIHLEHTDAIIPIGKNYRKYLGNI